MRITTLAKVGVCEVVPRDFVTRKPELNHSYVESRRRTRGLLRQMNPLQSLGTLGIPGALALFESLAGLAWDWLGDARRLELGFSEDTISDLTMLEIARLGSNEVRVKRVSKRDERLVGFDWLWVIRRSGTPPIIYVVQAKKLKLQTKKYSYGKLKYRAGPKYQINALDDFANWVGAVPMYCFYNHVDDRTAGQHWHCREPIDVSQLGCTLVPLETVRSIHLYPDAVPWRCLFHPGCTSLCLHNISDLRSNLSLSRVFDFLPALISGDEDSIEMDDLISQLDLGELVNRYATKTFLPIPDRILSLNLED